MKVLELKGYSSLRALNSFHTLMLGLKMLPSYVHESYEDFFERVQDMPEADKEALIREATLFVNLEEDEVKSLAKFCCDPNGVPYTEENLNSLKAETIYDIIVAVALEVSKIRVDFVTDSEKKKSLTSV